MEGANPIHVGGSKRILSVAVNQGRDEVDLVSREASATLVNLQEELPVLFLCLCHRFIPPSRCVPLLQLLSQIDFRMRLM